MAWLALYAALLLVALLLARRRMRSVDDYIIGGWGLGPVIAGLSSSASLATTWAFGFLVFFTARDGPATIWSAAAAMLGAVISWFVIAPRVRDAAQRTGAATLIDLLSLPGRHRLAKTSRVSLAVLLACAMTATTAWLFRECGHLLGTIQYPGALAFDDAPTKWVVIVAVTVVFFVGIGGFWASCATDVVQAIFTAVSGVLFLVLLLTAVGGPAVVMEMLSGSRLIPEQGFFSNLAGFFGIGLAAPASPHVINRFIALRDERTLRKARTIALSWLGLVYGSGYLIGLVGFAFVRVQGHDINAPWDVLHLLIQVSPPHFAGLLVVGMLSAAMSTADSQLHVAGMALTYDCRGYLARSPLTRIRIVVFLVGAVATAIALYGTSYAVLGAVWGTLGPALTPAIFYVVWKGRLRAIAVVSSVLAALGTFLAFEYFLRDVGLNPLVPTLAPYAAATLAMLSTRGKPEGGERSGEQHEAVVPEEVKSEESPDGSRFHAPSDNPASSRPGTPRATPVEVPSGDPGDEEPRWPRASDLPSNTAFISYRRKRSAWLARGIVTELEEHRFDVFFDIDALGGGTFPDQLFRQIEQRRHFLVVLSPGIEEDLKDPDGWVRKEIEHAIRCERNVVSLLDDGFRFDSPEYQEARAFFSDTLDRLHLYPGPRVLIEYFAEAMAKLRSQYLQDGPSEVVDR